MPPPPPPPPPRLRRPWAWAVETNDESARAKVASVTPAAAAEIVLGVVAVGAELLLLLLRVAVARRRRAPPLLFMMLTLWLLFVVAGCGRLRRGEKGEYFSKRGKKREREGRGRCKKSGAPSSRELRKRELFRHQAPPSRTNRVLRPQWARLQASRGIDWRATAPMELRWMELRPRECVLSLARARATREREPDGPFRSVCVDASRVFERF